MMILITGGSGSGKSSFAENLLLEKTPAAPHNSEPGCLEKNGSGQCTASCWNRYYIATMEIYGEEGRKKVERHHQLRLGKGFVTIEKPRDIADSLTQLEEPAAVLVECMSNLTANEMFRENRICEEEVVIGKITEEICRLREKADLLVVVTNSVFSDGCDYDETSLAYLRALGKINQNLAAMADQVWELVAGIPLVLKSLL